MGLTAHIARRRMEKASRSAPDRSEQTLVARKHRVVAGPRRYIDRCY
jgi:hypothetical protein